MSASPSGRGASEPAAAPRRSISDQIADQIAVYIQRESLQPGDRLGREEDLARRFGVSRPTLREALRVLSSTHLIRASKGPGGGIFVAATPEQGIGRNVTRSVASMLESQNIGFDELLETRMLLEVPLAGLAAGRATEEDVAGLEALVAAQPAAADDHERLMQIGGQLHARIAAIAGNRLAGAFTEWVVDVLQPSLHELIAPALVEAVLAEQHRDIVRGIARGDPTAAQRAMREHLVYLGDLVQAMAPDQSASVLGGSAPPQR